MVRTCHVPSPFELSAGVLVPRARVPPRRREREATAPCVHRQMMNIASTLPEAREPPCRPAFAASPVLTHDAACDATHDVAANSFLCAGASSPGETFTGPGIYGAEPITPREDDDSGHSASGGGLPGQKPSSGQRAPGKLTHVTYHPTDTGRCCLMHGACLSPGLTPRLPWCCRREQCVRRRLRHTSAAFGTIFRSSQSHSCLCVVAMLDRDRAPPAQHRPGTAAATAMCWRYG